MLEKVSASERVAMPLVRGARDRAVGVNFGERLVELF
jgi:hypothetical protein